MEKDTGTSIPRRSLLRSVMGVAAGTELLSVNAVSASSHAHEAQVATEPLAANPPLYFSDSQYLLLSTLCQLIMPPSIASDSLGNRPSGGAIEAGVPAFIDLLTSENKDYQRHLSGGLLWLDASCIKTFNAPFVKCSERQQKAALDRIAYSSNAAQDKSAVPGIEFFAFLRALVLDGYFTSQIGIEYLEFRGNGAVSTFEGCPEAKSS